MLAFNFFFLPPLHTLALTDSGNWVALAVFVVTSVVVSELSTRARRRSFAAAEADALRRSDAAKTAILRAVSHDLRSPLTAILAAGEGLESRALELDDEDRAALLETIRTEAHRLDRLVANLLDLSRLEAGSADPRPELRTVDDLVAAALDGLGTEADRVTCILPEDTPLVRVDPAQIERALVNLVENALKFSPPGTPVEISVATADGDVVLRVRDRGPGLDPTRSTVSSSRSYPAAGRTAARGAGSASRSCRASRRRTAAGYGPSRDRPEERRSRSRCPRPSSGARRRCDERGARARRRRRAADPPGARDKPSGGGVRGRDRRNRRAGARPRGRAPTQRSRPRPRPPGRQRNRRHPGAPQVDDRARS